MRTTDCRSPALSILRRRLAVVSLTISPWLPPLASAWRAPQAWGRSLGSGVGSRLWLVTDERVASDFDDRCGRSSSLNLSAVSNRAHTSAGMLLKRAASRRTRSASVIWSSGTRSKSSAIKASSTAICAATDTGANSGCLRQARIRRPCSMILRVFSSSRVPNPVKGLRAPRTARVGELEIARHGTVSRALRLAADARDRFADIDRRQHAQFEQRRREVNLSVRDGNQVGRNVGGNVLRFGFDNRQRRQRSATEFQAQVRCALQQARVEVEDVAGKRLAAGRATQ